MVKWTGNSFVICMSHKIVSRTGVLHTAGQMMRYGIVGILNNLIGYLIYLALTWLWLEPKLAVTLLYPIGALTGYFGNAKYAFTYDGHFANGLLRYIIAHFVGYFVNIALIYVFSDKLLFPHQIVQAVAIFVVAGVLFILFKYFVFRTHAVDR